LIFYLSYTSITISCIYALLIISLIRRWEENSTQNPPSGYHPSNSLSVIIIARNEEENIVGCLNSVLSNDFPKEQYEIIVVDDHSTDKTIQKIQNIASANIKILSLADYVGSKKVNAFKKEGIIYALQHTKFDYIIHTDADCHVPNNWLIKTAYNFEQGIKLQAAPIGFKPTKSFLDWFQQLDMYTLMACTNAGIRSKKWYLANGANLAYQHSSLPANIYSESDKFASGDDVYLINQMAQKNADQLLFDASLKVTTPPIENLQHFIRQRIRWAGKNRNLGKGKMKNILLIPVITNLWVFIILFLIPFVPKIAIVTLFFFLLTKAMIDYAFLNYMQESLNPDQKNRYFLPAFICYPFYIIIIGIVSLFTKSYIWKSRRVH